ncbi:MAG: 1-acyl-sn-glycerol-3-phosphate acyltransferase [Flavobacteriales bacterium]|jgi:1-acyl-sn-glycerol-3-phosphate acyltransferase
MFRLFCLFIFWIQGWKISNWNVGDLKKYVIIALPHTSNWDFIIAIAVFKHLKIPMKFTIKDSWLKFPFGHIVKPLGAIGIKRNLASGMVNYMADLITNHPTEIALVVTPEGTRSKVEKWKTGFYHIALKANLPIALGYVDYAKKEAGVAKLIYPSGDIKKDMEEIIAFYKTITPKHPEGSHLSNKLYD